MLLMEWSRIFYKNITVIFYDLKHLGAGVMKYRFLILLTSSITLILLVAVGYNIWENKAIKGKNFTKMSIYQNWDKEGPFVITEEKVINKLIKKINSSPKEEISKISFEHGPDGRIIFEGKNTVYEVKVFSFEGNIVTEKYLIKAGINFDKIIKKE
jgi:hypothetical protein